MTSDDFRSATGSLLQELGELRERLRSLSERVNVKRQACRLMTLAAHAARDERNTEPSAFGAYSVFCPMAGIKSDLRNVSATSNCSMSIGT